MKVYAGSLYVCDTTWRKAGNVTGDATTIVSSAPGPGVTQFAANTATMASRAGVVSNVDRYIETAGTSNAYTGCPTLNANPGNAITSAMLVPGAAVDVKFHMAGAGGATTINPCTLGAYGIKTAANTNPSSKDIVSDGRTIRLTFDGAAFRLPAAMAGTAISGERLNPYIDHLAGSTSSNTTIGNLNRVYMVRFVPYRTQTVTDIIQRVTVISAGGFLGAALYSSSLSKITESAKASTGTASILKSSLGAPQTLQAGTAYYIATSVNNATAQVTTFSIIAIHFLSQVQQIGHCTEAANFTASAGSVFPSSCTWNDLTTPTNYPMAVLE